MGKPGHIWGPSTWARRFGISEDWRLSCTDRHLRVDKGERQQVYPLWRVTDIALSSKWVWRTCRLKLSLPNTDPESNDQYQLVTLTGISRRAARQLQSNVRQQVRRLVADELNSLLPALDAWQDQASKELEQPSWIPQSRVEGLNRNRDQLLGKLTGMPARMGVDNPLVGNMSSLRLAHAVARAFSDELSRKADGHNTRWSEDELQRQQDFFSGVESNPLTEEQARAAVCFDDRVRLIAAAGSGKTSTMVARAGYAVRAGIARPEEIVLLAFNTDAAQELRDRIRTKLTPWVEGADKIVVGTFHAFALKVIGEATGRKPTVPSWLSNGQDLGAIVHIIHELMQADTAFRASVELFSVVFQQDLGHFKDIPRHNGKTVDPLMATSHERIVTLRGDIVKSQEEKALADWLLFHGIDYAYERPYPTDTADAEHGHYHPDFYYPDIDLYHEHLALDANGKPPPHFENYAEGVTWKRELHRRDGNRYMETTSHQLREGTAFDHLKETLEHYGLTPTPSLDNLTEEASPLAVPDLAKLIRTFMQHFKANGYTFELVSAKSQQSSAFAFRAKLFLRIVKAVLEAWDQRLADEGALDFDDMLNRAADLMDEGRWVSPYRVVAVDEWQDTSAARARVAKGLNTQGASLFVVGDDFQGVYAFAGADIRYMTEFDRRVGRASTLFLTETFRCPQNLNDVATEFVMANPAQITKSVTSHNPMEGRSVRAIPHPKGALSVRLLHELQRLDAHAKAQDSVFEVLLLGRYRHDCPDELYEWQQSLSSNLRVQFSTVHQAKGLEADYVFILNLHLGSSGFPAQKSEDTLISLVMPEPDPYPHAEERRLFYVALTRAKRRVVLFAEEERVSTFLTELEQYGLPPLVTSDGSRLERCSKCKEGLLVRRKGRQGEFLGCSRYPACRHTKSASTHASARF